MATYDSEPLGVGCGSVNGDVLDMLETCSAIVGNENSMKGMKYVGRLANYHSIGTRRLLRGSPEQEQTPREEEHHQSEQRELQDYCWNTGLDAGQRTACCMFGANAYSYCASSPTDETRRLADTTRIAEDIPSRRLELNETVMGLITERCTMAFQKLAEDYATPPKNISHCLGSSDEVFCESIQIFVGKAHRHNATSP